MEVAAITAGPVKNLTAIENVATDFPQAMIFGCKAMNKPANESIWFALIKSIELTRFEANENEQIKKEREEQDEYQD